MATYVISASCKNDTVAFTVHSIDNVINDPENINNYTDWSLFCYGKTKISETIYQTSPLRSILNHNMFGSGTTRFDIEFATLSLMKFLYQKLHCNDVVIFAGVEFIRPMVRGAIEPVEDFELDIIRYCTHFGAVFTNTRLHCNFNQIINSITINPVIGEVNNTSWIKTH